MTHKQRFAYYGLGGELNNYPQCIHADHVTIMGFMDSHVEMTAHLCYVARKVSPELETEIRKQCAAIAADQ